MGFARQQIQREGLQSSARAAVDLMTAGIEAKGSRVPVDLCRQRQANLLQHLTKIVLVGLVSKQAQPKVLEPALKFSGRSKAAQPGSGFDISPLRKAVDSKQLTEDWSMYPVVPLLLGPMARPQPRFLLQ